MQKDNNEFQQAREDLDQRIEAVYQGDVQTKLPSYDEVAAFAATLPDEYYDTSPEMLKIAFDSLSTGRWPKALRGRPVTDWRHGLLFIVFTRTYEFGNYERYEPRPKSDKGNNAEKAMADLEKRIEERQQEPEATAGPTKSRKKKRAERRRYTVKRHPLADELEEMLGVSVKESDSWQIRALTRQGATDDMLRKAARITASRDFLDGAANVWRYFKGVARNLVTDEQEDDQSDEGPGPIEKAVQDVDVDIDAERCVLGGLLLLPEVIEDVPLLEQESFVDRRHAIIFRHMKALWDEHETIDVTSLVDRLRKEGTYDEAGGAAYLALMSSSVPNASLVAYHAGRVIELHNARLFRPIVDKVRQA